MPPGGDAHTFMHRETRNILLGVFISAILLVTVNAFFDASSAHPEAPAAFFPFDRSTHDIIFLSLFLAVVLFGGYRFIRSREARLVSRDELQRHMTAVEASMDGVAIYDKNGNYLYVNAAYARINGYKAPGDVVGKSFALVYGDSQRVWMEQNIPPSIQKTGRWHGELLARRRDGTVYIQEASVTTLHDGGRVCIIRDITERKQREEEVKRSERLLNSIFASIHDPFCVFDDEFKIVKVNQAYAEIKGKIADELVGRTCYKVLEGRDGVCEGCVIRKTIQSGDPCAKEKQVTLSSGETHWLEIFTYPILDDNGNATQVIEYTRDVTDRKKSEKDRKQLIGRLEYLSKVDGLTGLLNRRALTEQLAYEIERSRRFAAPLSIILCDMDNLKGINDKHGHLAGDTAIQLVSATIRNVLRSVDIAGRYGGDEFLVIVPETPIEGARSIAEKVREAIQKTEIRLEGNKTLEMSMSMGIAALAALPENTDGFISRVDSALYSSKHAGRNRISAAE